jgi:hypothetical protein
MLKEQILAPRAAIERAKSAHGYPQFISTSGQNCERSAEKHLNIPKPSRD